MIRIAWNINGRIGHSYWHQDSDKNLLEADINHCNCDYGPHTHWLEQSATAEDCSVDELTEVVK